mmetsp:Transcript_20781/g.45765  ORF Transcript_20781/g.45765 Transcript_20781/m.45765 type:complete len:124 (-) Transcript_20781:1311-1682(-)
MLWARFGSLEHCQHVRRTCRLPADSNRDSCPSASVSYMRVGAALQEQLADVPVASFDCGEEWSVSVIVCNVYVSFVFQKEENLGRQRSAGCKVQRRVPIRVFGVHVTPSLQEKQAALLVRCVE